MTRPTASTWVTTILASDSLCKRLGDQLRYVYLIDAVMYIDCYRYIMATDYVSGMS